MSNFFKNTRKLSLILSSLLLVITLTAGTFAYAANGFSSSPPEAEEDPYADAELWDELGSGDDFPEVSTLAMETVTPVSYNTPSEMRGVYLVPGSDFIKSKDASEDTIRAEIDKAVADAKALDMNSVIIDTLYNDSVIFDTADAKTLIPGFDIMDYLVNKCREEKLYVYAIFDASHYTGDLADKLSANAGEFAQKYRLDGVLIDGYAIGPVQASYSDYINDGGSMGFENYMRQGSASVVKTVAGAVRKASPDTQAGLLADAVWANSDENELGSPTKAKYTSLISGNADTKAYVERGFVDFVAVKAYSLLSDADEPFSEIASWWANVGKSCDAPVYIIHASDKIGTSGWTTDEIAMQTTEASKFGGCRGSIYNSLKKLPAASGQTEAPAQDTTVKNAAAPAASSQPEVVPVSTAAAQNQYDEYNGYGSNDKSKDDEESENDDFSDYSSDDYNDDESSYSSANGSGIIKSISPTGIIFGDGNETIKLSAVAYRDATVYAEIDGETVRLTLNSSSGGGEYGTFTGTYKVPSPDYDDDVQMLGSLTVSATANGTTEVMDGAYLKIGKEKTPVQIVTDQARTYPANTKDNVPIPTMYPLPKGAIDYAVGKTFTYTSSRTKEKFTYVLLESGVRVETKDLKEIKKGPSKNKISGMTVTAEGDGYTYVMLKTAQKVTYSVAYKGDSIQITFNNTTSVPNNKKLSKNPMFTNATWSGGNKLTLTLSKSNGFMGFKGYYDSDGNLVFKFNHPPTSIKNARIAIDPGHGGKDTGALGTNSKYYEAVLTRAIAKQLATQLEDRGAKVLLLDTSNGMTLDDRVSQAEKWNADIFVSVHCNTAPNKNATGTEVYYFYPYSKPLAHYSAAGVSKSFDTTNRGAKNSYYVVTLSSQMSSALVECGFMTNKAEYAKLVKSAQHKKIAAGIVAGIESSIKYSKISVSAKGTESVGSKVSSSSVSEDDDYSDSDEDVYRMTGGGKVTELTFDSDIMSLNVDETAKLSPIFEPENADNIAVTWTSSASRVVSVDEKGTVTALQPGTATITARTKDGSNKRATVKITVTEEGSSSFKDSGISLSSAGYVYMAEDYLTIYPGIKERVEIISGSDKVVKNADFKWTSSKTSVATVDQYGVVTAKSTGNATITATGGGKTLTCEIDVSKDKVAVSSIELDKTSLTLVRYKSAQLKATLSPRGATDKTITWTSSSDRIASVDSNGLITAKNNTGTCTITAKSKSGNYKATCTVKVIANPIAVDYIELHDSALELRKGDSEALSFELYPENATESGLIWKSSSSSVVSVDEDGTVTALKKGTATITVTSASNKNISEKCKITVYE